MQSRNANARTWILTGIGLLALILGAIALFNSLSTNNAGTGNTRLGVTIFPQATVPPTLPPAMADQPPTSMPDLPTTEPQTIRQYVVEQNDTMWDIAVKFGVTLEQIVGANPGINPDLLGLGQTLNIPPSTYDPPALPTSAAVPLPNQPQVPNAPNLANAVQGYVLADAGGLRLRSLPSADAEIITRLGPNTQLQILGEVAGQPWIQVVTPNGTQGFVMAAYVAIGGGTILPTLEPAQGLIPTAPSIPVGPLEYPFLSDVSARVYDIFRSGQAQGNSPNRVVLVGDSNTDNPQFFAPFDYGNYNLGNYPYLQSTVEFFKGSFAQNSPAAKGGFNTTQVLAQGGCGDTNLACALNQQKPSVALILLGTGDQHTWQTFEDRYRRIVEITIARGVIPVLITKADDLECRDNSAPCGFINGKIATIAGEYQVPLLNLRQVVQPLPGGGCIGDGFHFSFPPDNKSAWFTPDYLQYGYTQRNLTALQTLDVIRRKVLQG